MQKTILILFIATITLFGCGRKATTETDDTTSSTPTTETTNSNKEPRVKDETLITSDDPFKNQPNTFCTVIRKLDISYYAPEKQIDDVRAFPKKYCLLDVCLEKIDPNGMIINLGDENEVVTSSFELIKIFDTEAEARNYVAKYQITDVVWE